MQRAELMNFIICAWRLPGKLIAGDVQDALILQVQCPYGKCCKDLRELTRLESHDIVRKPFLNIHYAGTETAIQVLDLR